MSLMDESDRNPNPIWSKKYCPCLMGEGGYVQCKEQVTQDYISRLCNTAGYANCFHYCKKFGLLKKPFEWIQVLAVEKSKTEEDKVAL